MKSRIGILTFVAVLSSAQAFGAFTETEPTRSSGTWERVTTTVKVKVQEWWDYWNGGQKPQEQTAKKPSAPAKPTAAVGTGTTAPSQAAAPVTATTQAQAPQAPAPVAQVAPAKPAPSEANTALKQQPLFEERAKGASLKDVRALRDTLRAAPVMKVAKPGRAGTTKLPKSKQGVPVVDWSKLKATKRIPRLDIGTESLVSRHDFSVESLSWGLQKPSDLKRLPTAKAVEDKQVKQLLAIQVQKALGARGLQANKRTVGQPVTLETVAKIQYAVTPAADVKLLPYKPLTEEHMKMVAALLLFEKGGSCHIIMGLFHQLAAAPATKQEATYHLGACADQLKMDQAAFDALASVLKSEDKDFAAQALELLAKDLPIIYEREFYTVVTKLRNLKSFITESSQDNVAYRVAKGAYRAGDYKTSIAYADRVNSGTDFSDEARFLSAMNSFALNDKKNALKKLQGLWESLEARKVQNSNIRALTSVNLARMYFAQKQYDKALTHYMQVPKDHALWVQALIEQGWTQLAIADYAGAIGNMYSLHSPYFKAVYQPESFVVRTIGYINICQYGDAYKSLSWLEKDYRAWYERTSNYLNAKSQPLTVYNTVKTYIRGKSDADVEGVPHQVWREMARRKDFLNLQTALNENADEARRYEGVNEKIKAEKAQVRAKAEASKKRFEVAKGQFTKAKSNGVQGANLETYSGALKRERDLTIGYRFILSILEQSRQGYLDYQKTSQAKLDKENGELTAQAGDTLLKRARTMREEMGRVLENNEFLRYEVFSGSGENIRYQVAGGDVGQPNRIPAHIKPTKMMNWNFDGEFWEDEIGSYRSSLQNVCPSAQTAPPPGTTGKQEGDQASLNGF